MDSTSEENQIKYNPFEAWWEPLIREKKLTQGQVESIKSHNLESCYWKDLRDIFNCLEYIPLEHVPFILKRGFFYLHES